MAALGAAYWTALYLLQPVVSLKFVSLLVIDVCAKTDKLLSVLTCGSVCASHLL